MTTKRGQPPHRSRCLVLSLLILLAAGRVWAASPIDEIPFVPTPIEVVDRMLEMAEVKKDDVVYDLGSGDGRIVTSAKPRKRF